MLTKGCVLTKHNTALCMPIAVNRLNGKEEQAVKTQTTKSLQLDKNPTSRFLCYNIKIEILKTVIECYRPKTKYCV